MARCKSFKRYLAVALLIEFLFLAVYTPYTSSALNIAENLASHMHYWVRLKEDRLIDFLKGTPCLLSGICTEDLHPIKSCPCRAHTRKIIPKDFIFRNINITPHQITKKTTVLIPAPLSFFSISLSIFIDYKLQQGLINLYK